MKTAFLSSLLLVTLLFATVSADSLQDNNEEQQPQATTSTTVRMRLGVGGVKGKKQNRRSLASIGDVWNTLVNVITRKDDDGDCEPDPSFTLNSNPKITFAAEVNVEQDVDDAYLTNLANNIENGLKTQGKYTASVACSLTTTAFDYVQGSFSKEGGQVVEVGIDWSVDSSGAACLSETAVHTVLLEFGDELLDTVELSQYFISSIDYSCDRDPECPTN